MFVVEDVLLTLWVLFSVVCGWVVCIVDLKRWFV